MCRASRSAAGAPSQRPSASGGAVEKSPSASSSSSSLQRTRAIAWQGGRRVIADHLVAAHFFSRLRIHPLMNATACRRCVCRASRSTAGAPSRLPSASGGAAEKSPSASSSSSLQRTRAIARQGDRRVIVGRLAAAHFFSRSHIHPLTKAAVCRRRRARRVSRSVAGAPSRRPSASSSLQRTRAIARQGDRRLLVGHLAAAHFF